MSGTAILITYGSSVMLVLGPQKDISELHGLILLVLVLVKVMSAPDD